MATRSTIGYETPDGGYIGVHCHWDGYPDNIAPQLKRMSWEDVSFQVDRALLQGGGRSLDGCEIHTWNETIPAEQLLTTKWPTCSEDYAYRKRLDGSVECVNYMNTPISLKNY